MGCQVYEIPSFFEKGKIRTLIDDDTLHKICFDVMKSYYEKDVYTKIQKNKD